MLLKSATLSRRQLQMEMSSFLAVPVAIPMEHEEMQQRGIWINKEWQVVERWTEAIGCFYAGSSAQVVWALQGLENCQTEKQKCQELAPRLTDYRARKSQGKQNHLGGQKRVITFRWESSLLQWQGWRQKRALCAKDRGTASHGGRSVLRYLRYEFCRHPRTVVGWRQNISYCEMAIHLLV